MNFKWTWSIVTLHLYFYSHLVLSLHLPASLFISSHHPLYLSCCLSTISPLPLSVWPLHSHISFTSSFLPRFLSATHLSTFHLPILSSLLFILSLLLSSLPSFPLSSAIPPLVSRHIYFPSILKSFFSLCTRPLHTSLHLAYIPFLCLLLSPPSSTLRQTRVDKVEKKPVLTSEGISIYNQSVCVPADQQQPYTREALHNVKGNLLPYTFSILRLFKTAA